MTIRTAGLLLLALMFTTADAAPASGVGGRSCTTYIELAEQNDDASLDSYVSWAQGFISGSNWTGHSDLLIDVGSMNVWLVSWCRKNPDGRFYEAVSELVERNR